VNHDEGFASHIIYDTYCMYCLNSADVFAYV